MSGPGFKGDEGEPGAKDRRKQSPSGPGWASGLRQLYDAVVEEPLPDSFADLLKKLDQASHD